MLVLSPASCKRIDSESNRFLNLLSPPSEGFATLPLSSLDMGLTERIIVGAEARRLLRPVMDGLGNTWMVFAPCRNGWIGLCAESYAPFLGFVRETANRLEARHLLSRKFIEESLFAWMLNQKNGVLHRDFSASKWLVAEAQEACKSFQLYFPIESVLIEEPFVIGAVTIAPLPPELVLRYEAQLNSNRHSVDDSEIAARMDKVSVLIT